CPGTAVRAAVAALGSDGSVLARSGAESALMAVNYGSVAKLEALDLAVEAFGPAQVRDLMLPPGGCVRWTWSTKDLRRSHPSRYCPTDVAPATRPMALDEAVARSINSLTARHAMLLPPLLAQRRPDFASRQFLARDRRADRRLPASQAVRERRHLRAQRHRSPARAAPPGRHAALARPALAKAGLQRQDRLVAARRLGGRRRRPLP